MCLALLLRTLATSGWRCSYTPRANLMPRLRRVQRLTANAVPAMPAMTDGRQSRARVLVNRGRSLLQHGSTALEDCEIYEDAELYFVPDMQIFVKTLTGETCPCPGP